MSNNTLLPNDSATLGTAALVGGAGALGGGLIGAKTMIAKTFEDYKADRLAWSQRKQRARERGVEDTRDIDRERPRWVSSFIKAALKGGLLGSAVGGIGGTLAASSSGKLIGRIVEAKQAREFQERLERFPGHASLKTSSSPIVSGCFDYVRNLYRKEAGLGETVSRSAANVGGSLRDREFLKKLLRAMILGAGGAAVGGLGGSLLTTKGVTYDRYGRPKRKSRAGLGALVGGAGGAAVGLLANPKRSDEHQHGR